MRMNRRRDGFTLIEMLVVLIIVLALSAMFALAIMRMGDKNLVPSGAQDVQGMLAAARSRALFEKRGVGVRFIVATQNPPGFPAFDPTGLTGMVCVDQLQYIHDPGDFADGWVVTDADPTTPGEQQLHPDTGAVLAATDPLFGRLIYGPPRVPPGMEPYFNFSFGDAATPAPGGGAVMPGDKVEFHGGGQAFTVHPLPSLVGATRSVYHFSQTPLNRTILVLDLKLDRPIQQPPSAFPRVNYRVMRQPRPVAGEAPVKLPREVAIILRDLTGYAPPRNSFPLVSTPVTGNIDIMFEPSGRVLGSPSEAIMLWLSDSASARIDPATNAPNDTNWAIIGIYTRTGSISVYPVDLVSGNPYSFAQVGRGTGM